jgi:hypothetical protein
MHKKFFEKKTNNLKIEYNFETRDISKHDNLPKQQKYFFLSTLQNLVVAQMKKICVQKYGKCMLTLKGEFS